jgi:hypothetical protein
MPPILRLWQATTHGERLLALGAILSYCGFVVSVIRALRYGETTWVIPLSGISAAMTLFLVRSLMGSKGSGF